MPNECWMYNTKNVYSYKQQNADGVVIFDK